jgi:hypothetical protein
MGPRPSHFLINPPAPWDGSGHLLSCWALGPSFCVCDIKEIHRGLLFFLMNSQSGIKGRDSCPRDAACLAPRSPPRTGRGYTIKSGLLIQKKINRNSFNTYLAASLPGSGVWCMYAATVTDLRIKGRNRPHTSPSSQPAVHCFYFEYVYLFYEPWYTCRSQRAHTQSYEYMYATLLNGHL